MDKEEIERESMEFIENEFDGVESSADRSATVVADFGLPLDLRDISPSPTNDEFEASGEPKTRALGALEIRSNTHLATDVEFDIGASFQASSSLFASSKKRQAEFEVLQAPLLPFYLRVEKTSFNYSNSVSVLIPELENAFHSLSVSYSTDEKNPCTYLCSVLVYLALVEFEVRVFAKESSPEHLVEFRHMSGCRYSFSDTFKRLSEPFADTATEHLAPPPLKKFAPLTLCDDDELMMPALLPSSPCSVISHELSLLSGDAGVDANLQGARAVGYLSQGSVDMSDGGFGVPLANQITKLASSDNDNDVLRTVAMGALANLVETENVSMNWMNSTVDSVVAGVKDDHPHIRREAMRSMETMSKRSDALAAQFVRAGMLPLLEIEATGGAEDQIPDFPAQEFARGALNACRA